MVYPQIQIFAAQVATRAFGLPTRIFLINLMLLQLIFMLFPAKVTAQEVTSHSSPHILIVNSYHKGYPWSDNIVTEIEMSLERYLPGATLEVEYMDTKTRGFSPEYQELLYNLFRYKFASHRFGLIITTDDNALDFVSKNHAEIFHNAPVIFTGVNDVGVDKKINRILTTGILSVDAGADSIAAILKLLPDTERLLLIYDNSETGEYLYNLMKESFDEFPNLTFERLDSSYTMAELQKRLAKDEPNTAAILGMFFHDKTGQYFDIATGTHMLTEASNIPIFALHGQVFDHGTLGGKLLYGRQFGKKALEMAAQILSGTSPGDMPFVNNTLAEYIYDARQLLRYDIDLRNLPAGSVLLNEPTTIFHKYGRLLIWMAVGGTVLCAVIAYLLYVNAKRRRAQNLFEALFNLINVGIFQMSSQGELMLMNNTARRILKIDQSPPDDIKRWLGDQRLYREDGTFVRPEDRPLSRALEKTEEVTDELYQVCFSERDEKRWVRISAAPHRDKSANPIEFGLVSFYDVTEQIESEQKLRRSEKMEALGNVIAGVAHDFNNALAIVRGNLDGFQLTHSTDAKMDQDIKACKDSVTRCVRLTERLLSFARRRDEHQQGGAAKVIELNTYLTDAHGFLRKSLTPEIEFDLDLHESLFNIKVDPEDLENALINLAVNARDAMNGKGHLKIQTSAAKTSSESQPCVEIVISDTGSGISEKDIERIFEPFYSTKTKNKGTGLGLSMVYGFVTRSGGRIFVTSEPGEGTNFHIILPLVSPDCAVSAENVTDETVYRGTGTILVLDDEDGLLDTTCRLLKALGYKTYGATGYDTAVRKLREHPEIQMVLSDVLLGGTHNGIDFTRYVHENYPNMPVILMSGQLPFHTENIVTGDKLDVIEKPFSASALSQKIRKILDDNRQDAVASA